MQRQMQEKLPLMSKLNGVPFQSAHNFIRNCNIRLKSNCENGLTLTDVTDVQRQTLKTQAAPSAFVNVFLRSAYSFEPMEVEDS